jgi:hypothetical protein
VTAIDAARAATISSAGTLLQTKLRAFSAIGSRLPRPAMV